MPYTIRKMNRNEVDLAISMAAGEGWNPGLNDAECFYNTDPDGFFAGELNGDIIAVISAVRYNNAFGFVGLYIVKEKFKGKGFGIQIWNRAMDNLKDITSGLDGVVAQQANYMKSGFNYAYRQVRYEGKDIKGKVSPGLIDVKLLPFEDVYKYDTVIFPAAREIFLRNWINQPGISAKAVVKDNMITGYGVIRPCQKGYKIGPLFADDHLTAENIFLALADFAVGKEIYLDIPEVNKAGQYIVDKYNLKYVFETARMYRSGNPDKAVNKVFGVTTFELG